MEIPYTVYDVTTGQIIQTGCCEESRIKYQAQHMGQAILLGCYLPETYYVDVVKGKPVQKEPMMLSYELGSIQGVPYGSSLYIKELNKRVRADDLASIQLEQDGEYTITVSHPRYRTGTVRLTAG